MGSSDKVLGTIGLIFGCGLWVYMVIRLIVIPILPLNEDNPFKMGPPTLLLVTSGVSGLLFVGSLALFTLYTLYRTERHQS